MSISNQPHIVINPTSGGGRTAKLQTAILQHIERRIGKTYSLCVTQKPKDAMRSVAEALESGCTHILVVGGDGTIHEAVNGLMQNGFEAARNCTLGIISSGSGQGVALSLGLPRSLAQQIELALCGETVAVDAARISFVDANGLACDRYFINECQIGIGAEVVRKTTPGRKRMGGRLAYGLRTLSLLFRYESSRLSVWVDGQEHVSRQLMGVVIGNGPITAGGMQLTPNAVLNDGALDLLIIQEQSVLQRIRSFSRIYNGRHVFLPTFESLKGRSVRIESEGLVNIAADGEFLGHLPCSVEVVPSALQIRCREKSLEDNYANSIEQLEAIGV
jgi:YegS/Rv2252/BmrU family lipid kinase